MRIRLARSSGAALARAARRRASTPSGRFHRGRAAPAFHIVMRGFLTASTRKPARAPVAADLDAQITAISGTSVTLSIAPSQSGTHTMRHDNSPALQQAVNASVLAGITGSKVQLPACATHYDMAQAVSFWELSQTGISGPGNNFEGLTNANIRWDGPPGGVVFNFNCALADTIEGLGLDGLSGSTPGILIDQNNYGTSTPSTQGPGAPSSGVAWAGVPPTGLQVRNVNCGVVGLCVDLGPVIANGEDAVIDGLQCGTPNGVGGLACIYSNSQETYNEAIYNTTCGGRDYCFDFPRIGSFVAPNTNGNAAGILFYNPEPSNYGKIMGGQEEACSSSRTRHTRRTSRTSESQAAAAPGPQSFRRQQRPVREYRRQQLGNHRHELCRWRHLHQRLFRPAAQFPRLHAAAKRAAATIPATPPARHFPVPPYFIPITSSNGYSAIPNFTCIHCSVNGQSVPGVVSNEVNQATSLQCRASRDDAHRYCGDRSLLAIDAGHAQDCDLLSERLPGDGHRSDCMLQWQRLYRKPRRREFLRRTEHPRVVRHVWAGQLGDCADAPGERLDDRGNLQRHGDRAMTARALPSRGRGHPSRSRRCERRISVTSKIDHRRPAALNWLTRPRKAPRACP